MTVFRCSVCAIAITPDLVALPAVPATVPRGHYAIVTESRVVIHPEDAIGLENAGRTGLKRSCSCGVGVATSAGPNELRLDPTMTVPSPE